MKKKILVVDDEPDQIYSLKLVLEYNGRFEVISAKNGEECIRLLGKKNLPDLILLDVMMPKMSGWEVLKHLKSNAEWKDIPVIIITALTGKDNGSEGRFIPDDYIEKPYDVEDLKKRVYNVLNKNR